MKKNLMMMLLSAAFIIIWGIIIMRVVNYFGSLTDAEQDASIMETDTIDIENNKPIENNDFTLSRDPFNSRMRIEPADSVAFRKKANEIKTHTNFRIKGVISSSNRNIVVLENLSDNSVHMLKEGDKYNEIKIIRVFAKHVKIAIYDEEKSVEY